MKIIGRPHSVATAFICEQRGREYPAGRPQGGGPGLPRERTKRPGSPLELKKAQEEPEIVEDRQRRQLHGLHEFAPRLFAAPGPQVVGHEL